MNKKRKFLLYLTAFAVLAGPSVAAAAGGGRVGNPKNLRVKKTQKERGRIMRRPPMPDPKPKQPATIRATIPDPTPRRRGGSGYTRRGKYFYEKPKPVYAGRGTSKRLLPPDPTFRKSR